MLVYACFVFVACLLPRVSGCLYVCVLFHACATVRLWDERSRTEMMRMMMRMRTMMMMGSRNEG